MGSARRHVAPVILLAIGGGYAGMLGLGRYAAAAGGAPPLAFALWQVLGGAVALLGVCAARRLRVPGDARHLRYYLTAGFLGSALPTSLAFLLVDKIGAGLTGLMFALTPICTYAIAVGGRFEPFDRVRTLGVAIGLAGSAMIVAPVGGLPAMVPAGWIVAGLLIPLSFGAVNVYRTHAWPTETPVVPITAGSLTVSALLLLPVVAWTGSWYVPTAPTHGPDLALIVVIALAGWYFIGVFELQRIAGATYVSQMGNVITVVSLIIGLTIFGETLTLWLWIAAVLIFVGVALVSLRPAPRPHAAQPLRYTGTGHASQRH